MSNFDLTVYERDRPLKRVVVLLGDAPPNPAQGGGGGWQQVPLPKRSAVTVWVGRDALLELNVPIVIGGVRPVPRGGERHPHALVRPGRAISSDYGRLVQMWRPTDPRVEPPVVRLRCSSDAIPAPFRGLPYVLNDLQWGDAVADQNARRTLQKLTLVLVEYRPDERLHAVLSRTNPDRHERTFTHRVVKGETLTSIAKRFKVRGGWRTLGQAQRPKITDPRKIRVGQLLTIPTSG